MTLTVFFFMLAWPLAVHFTWKGKFNRQREAHARQLRHARAASAPVVTQAYQVQTPIERLKVGYREITPQPPAALEERAVRALGKLALKYAHHETRVAPEITEIYGSNVIEHTWEIRVVDAKDWHETWYKHF